MPPTTIQNGVVVSLEYTLTLDDGEVVDEATADAPLEYLHGADNIIPGLEKALTGLKIGDRKQVVIQPEEGYGEYDPEDMEEVERSLFPDDLELEEGMMLTMSDENDNLFDAVVVDYDDEIVTLDFNHPLAGETLHFTVRVLALRDATEEEKLHGHPHNADADHV
jgi:FKBP-type peptidyl-prolyl cis-trans isomerase SlyD